MLVIAACIYQYNIFPVVPNTKLYEKDANELSVTFCMAT